MASHQLHLRTSAPVLGLAPSSPATINPCAACGLSEGATRRRVLIIASRFPPLASVGAIRVRKFVKYLDEFGWEPVVLTGPVPAVTAKTEDARHQLDLQGLEDVPEHIEVARLANEVDDWPAAQSDRWGRRLGKLTGLFGLQENRWRAGLQWRFERLQNRWSFPDQGIWRLVAATRLAKALHGRHRFDAIFSTGMPFSDHMTGYAVKKALKLPWIADFRDPWVEYIHWKQWNGRWGAAATRQAERVVLRHATRVVSVNDHMTARFKIRYPELAREKFDTIENGFDPSDFYDAAPDPRHQKFTIQHAGSLYGARSPEYVIAAFKRFVGRCERAQNESELVFLGRIGSYKKQIDDAGSANIRYGGMLSHADTCRAMRRAAVNLVLLPNVTGSDHDTTAKVYECLGSGRPVLAAVPLKGSAAGVLSQRPHTYLHDPEDVDGMADTFERLFHRWQTGALEESVTDSGMYRFTRRAGTEKLAEILDQCCPLGAREAVR